MIHTLLAIFAILCLMYGFIVMMAVRAFTASVERFRQTVVEMDRRYGERMESVASAISILNSAVAKNPERTRRLIQSDVETREFE